MRPIRWRAVEADLAAWASACCRRIPTRAQRPKRCSAALRVRRRRPGRRSWSRWAATASCSRPSTGCWRTMPPMPVFGMNRGTVGFLMNEWRLDGLAERIAAAKAIRVAPLEMQATTVGGRPHPRRDQRSLAAPRDPPDRQDREFGQRPGRHARAGLRRRARRDAGRLDGLQFVGARADPAARGEDARADADQPVPAAALVGRDPARRDRGLLPGARGREPAGLGGRRPDRGARCRQGRGARSTASAR